MGRAWTCCGPVGRLPPDRTKSHRGSTPRFGPRTVAPPETTTERTPQSLRIPRQKPEAIRSTQSVPARLQQMAKADVKSPALALCFAAGPLPPGLPKKGF